MKEEQFAERLLHPLTAGAARWKITSSNNSWDLGADVTSSHTLRANQLRLWLAPLAYVFMNQLRRVGLVGTELARATCGTIRTRLLKVGAVVKVSVRRVAVSLSEAFPVSAALLAGRAATIGPAGLERLKAGECCPRHAEKQRGQGTCPHGGKK